MARYACLFSLWLVARSSFAQVPSSTDQVAGVCDEADDRSIEVHIGWPFGLSCSHLVTDLYLDDYVEDVEKSDEVAECIISDSSTGERLWNFTFRVTSAGFDDDIDMKYIQEANENTPSNYTTIFRSGTQCGLQRVHLKKLEGSKLKCDELAIQNPGDTWELHDNVHFRCAAPEPNFYFAEEHIPHIGYTWFHNCSEVKDRYVSEDGLLSISDSKFEDGGTYTCMISYNGKDRYVAHYDFCLKYRSSVGEQISMKCPEEVSVIIGESAAVKCSVDLGVGKANSVFPNAKWEKISSSGQTTLFCENDLEGVSNATEEWKGQCLIKSDQPERCYRFDPHFSVPPRDQSRVEMNIRSVNRSDLGKYRLTFGILNDHILTANITFSVDKGNLFKSDITVISACLATLLLIIFLILMCVCRIHDLQWFWKKYFGSYEKEFYTYTVYLAYYYDSENISEKSRKLIEDLVAALQEFMEKFGGTTYDDQQNVSPHQYDAETILHVQNDCHRILIVLTPEYVADQWSLHTTYVALQNVVLGGKKVIFVVTPGARKALHSLDKEPKRTLCYAMKRNVTVNWTGKTPFSGQFLRRLEYAFPKLPPTSYNRCLSTSSEAQLTHQSMHVVPSGSPPSGDTSESGFASVVV